MKRSKSSLVFQYLPNNWISYSDNDNGKGSYSMRISYWNSKEVTDIYKDRLIKQIKRKLLVLKICRLCSLTTMFLLSKLVTSDSKSCLPLLLASHLFSAAS